MKQAHLFIAGFVQGVNFRYFVKNNAEKLRVFGWIRNTEAGHVEVVLQGDREAIEKMVSLCRKGPFLAEVKDIQVINEEIKEAYTDFEIKPTG